MNLFLLIKVYLFGGCFHEWSKWNLMKDADGYAYQYRVCNNCNKMEITYV